MVAKSGIRITAPLLLVVSALLAAGNWYLQPGRAAGWASSVAVIGVMAVALLMVPRLERRARGTGDSIRSAVGFAGLILTIALGAKLATALGAIQDADISRRATMVIMGAFFVFTGNSLPKTLTPLASLQCDPSRVQAFQRFAGWTWVLTGFAFAIAWLVLPLDVAKPLSTGLLLAGMLTIAAQLIRLRGTRRREA